MVELNFKNWLKPEHIERDDVLTFMTEGEFVEIQGKDGEDPRKVFEIDVRLPNSDIKTWTINQSSQINVSKMYGMDTKAWIGKAIKVYKALQIVFGTEREVIYARAPPEEKK